jgi:hypothetical protein
MERRIALLAPLLLSGALLAQDGEFTVHPNGLIYSEPAMLQLQHIVDSLNLRFKACELDRSYRSLPHIQGRYITVEGAQVEPVAKDLEAGITLADFRTKYPAIDIGAPVRCALTTYTDSDDEPKTAVVPISFSDYMGASIDADGQPLTDAGPHKGKWLSTRYNYDKDFLEAFVLVEEPEFTPLPERYARLVQYVDCLIDTTELIYGADVPMYGRWNQLDSASKVQYLEAMVDSAVTVEWPQWAGEDAMDAYSAACKAYQVQRTHQLDSLATTADFRTALAHATQEALENGTSDQLLESLVADYGSKADALALRRSHRVMGGCSMDSGPRDHALAIATLSAETIHWDIFLRAHLDILNDNFPRASDGSWAQGARQTYVQELEALDINVPDLLLGTMFRLDNTTEGHYQASAGRTGRAITESEQAEEIAARVLAMIADPELDLYNRALFYYLFHNYNNNLDSASTRRHNQKLLKKAMAGLPPDVVGEQE